jgi:hypothetical protein
MLPQERQEPVYFINEYQDMAQLFASALPRRT